MSSIFTDFAARLRRFIQESGDRGEATNLEARFDQLALELFGLQFEHNLPYRRFCENRAAIPSKLTHWSQIPAIPTGAFKELKLTSLPPEHRQGVFRSSGTTEHRPSRHFHSAESLAIYEASLLPWFEQHVFADKSQLLNLLSLTPSADAAPNSSLVYMFDAIRRYLRQETVFAGKVASDGSWTIDHTRAIDFLHSCLQRGTPVLLLGTAFNFVHFLDLCSSEHLNFSLPPGSRVLETGGYKGRSRAIPKTELHRFISEHFGIPQTHIITEYGMSELSSQAYDDRTSSRPDNGGTDAHQRLFQFPPWAQVQIISPETGKPVADGQPGLIRIFDLANIWSVMAIQTEDLGIARKNGFELLGRATFAEPRGCSLLTTSDTERSPDVDALRKTP